MICQAAMLSIRDSKFFVKIFPGLAALLTKLVDEHIALLGGNLMQISQLVSQASPDITLEHPLIQNIIVQLDLIYEWA